MSKHHIRRAWRSASATMLLAGFATTAPAVQKLSVDPVQVAIWTRFADALYALHLRQLEGRELRTEESLGGYAGQPDFYREVKYFDARRDRLLSQIQWETANPDTLHNISVNRYDKDGRLSHDYYAGYLPGFRNAPVQTLINLHYQDDELHAFRQFDASGVRIYEQCRGEYFGETFLISLEEHQLPVNAGHPPATVAEDLYANCFGQLPTSVDGYLARLLSDDPQPESTPDRGLGAEEVAERISEFTAKIAATPKQAALYVQRGDARFLMHDFAAAIDDYSTAIALDDGQDMAWFGRGMARGRAGFIREGIADLSVYIARHPDSSRAHTKRGVRYIWLGDLDKAQGDLSRAVALDDSNAEAHDDLGVLFAQQRRYEPAEMHFRAAIRHDPGYQKAHHNLALVQHLTRRHTLALATIDDALRLAPRARDSLLLKSAILEALGRRQEAQAIADNAEFLPEGNWSERFPLQ